MRLPTLELGSRLVSRAPDMTRLLDRLEARGLIHRERLSGPPGRRDLDRSRRIGTARHHGDRSGTVIGNSWGT